jgi:hypothetical protein
VVALFAGGAPLPAIQLTGEAAEDVLGDERSCSVEARRGARRGIACTGRLFSPSFREQQGAGQRGASPAEMQRQAEDEGSAGEEEEVPPPLARTRTDYVLDEDPTKIWACTAAVVGPAVGFWYSRWYSWHSRLQPELDAMLAAATRFSPDHPILLDDGVDEFKRSRDDWLSAIIGVQESFKARFGEVFSDGEVTDPTSIISSIVMSVALLYVSMFLPDASIFLTRERRMHGLVRVPLSAVRHVRRCFLVLVAWQTYAVYSTLAAMYRISTAMDDSVKGLRVLGSELLLQREKYAPFFAPSCLSVAEIQIMLTMLRSCDRYPPESYSVHDATGQLVGKRWGLRLRVWPGVISTQKGWVVDVQFFHEFRFNAIVVAGVLSIFAYVLWERIREEREKQGKSSRSLLDKLLFREKQIREELEESHEELKVELEQTKSKLSSTALTSQRSVGSKMEGLDGDTIPYSSLKFEAEIDRGGYGIVYRGKWEGNVVAIKRIEMKETDMKRVELEAAIFLSLKHPHLVTCYGMSESPAAGLLSPSLCIVTEWCKFGSLDNVLHTPAKQVSSDKMLAWMREIASGMGYLHSHKIWHRDLKSANVLIDVSDSNVSTC